MHASRFTRKLLLVTTAMATALFLLPMTPALADHGNFTCRASALRADLPDPLLDQEPVVANDPNDPCAAENNNLLVGEQEIPEVGTVEDPFATTTVGETGATSQAGLGQADLLEGLVTATVLTSEAEVTCSGPAGDQQPSFSGSSTITELQVAGETVEVTGQEQTVPEVDTPLFTLTVELNEQVVTGQELTQRAVHVTFDDKTPADLDSDVVIAEATVDASEDNPCPHGDGDLPECSDNVDNADPEDTLADEDDPGCHSDGDATNPDSYNPNDDDETDEDVNAPECSDNVDNADPEDTLADEDDPGCHTDGNAGNTDSYDPSDDDETDEGGGEPECSDDVDNDDPEDTLADEDDPGCHTDGNAGNPDSYDPSDDDETDEGGDEPECSDDVDNDDPEDTLADEDDPGCHSDGDATNPNSYDPNDDDETDEDVNAPECSDNVDNADPEDTLADEDDPGCHSDGDATNPDSYDPNDDDETDEDGDGGDGAPECSDEIDNDGDGAIDYSAEAGQGDPGCESPQDDDETNDQPPECSDGEDNDGDGEIDYPYDPGCDDREDDDESDGDGPECADTVDNDEDGATDFPLDDGCKSATDDDEADGFITGGGGYDELDEKRDNADSVSPGSRLRSAAGPLPCDIGDTPNANLTVTWHNGGTGDKGLLASWKLTSLTRAFCRNDPFIDPEQPDSEFDTYVGEGLGTFKLGKQTSTNVRAEWVRIDRGEPGSPDVIGIDYFEIYVFDANDQVVAYGTGTFDMGNKQAH